jgi:hypothetical protein
VLATARSFHGVLECVGVNLELVSSREGFKAQVASLGA